MPCLCMAYCPRNSKVMPLDFCTLACILHCVSSLLEGHQWSGRSFQASGVRHMQTVCSGPLPKLPSHSLYSRQLDSLTANK